MNIGLIAHDAKKKINAEFFVSLIVEYSANTVLYATETTGALIESVTNL